MKTYNRFIIGVITLFIFTFQVTGVHAFYSPILNGEATLVRQHIIQSKQKTGVGDFYTVGKKLVNNNQQTGSLFAIFWASVGELLFNNGLKNSVASVDLLFRFWPANGDFISTCLRDDLWEIQLLQEQLLDELFKAALLSNVQDANVLWADYQRLSKRIEGGEWVNSDGKSETIGGLKDTYKQKFWFPDSAQLYINCPYGEYTQAWQALSQSFDRMTALFGNAGSQNLGSFSLKSINNVARQRAIIRARQWILNNQLSFSIGGVNGSNPQSLIQGPGIQGLLGDVKTELTFVRALGDEVFNKTLAKLLPPTNTNLNQYVVAYETAQQDKNLATDQLERALVYNLSLSNVSEQSLAQMQKVLITTNLTIKSGYDQKIGKEGTIKNICQMLGKLAQNQCKNKSGGIDVNCN